MREDNSKEKRILIFTVVAILLIILSTTIYSFLKSENIRLGSVAKDILSRTPIGTIIKCEPETYCKDEDTVAERFRGCQLRYTDCQQGYRCSRRSCIERIQFTNAYWNVETAEIGKQITLTVECDGNCEGEIINFEVWKDLLVDELVEEIRTSPRIVDGMTSVTWTIPADITGGSYLYFKASSDRFPNIVMISSAIPVQKQSPISVCSDGDVTGQEVCECGLDTACGNEDDSVGDKRCPEGFEGIITCSLDCKSFDTSSCGDETNTGVTECSDGIDNDADGFIDENDPNCESPDDTSESIFSEVGALKISLNNKISDSNDKESIRGFISTKYSSLTLMNGGADYSASLQAQIDALPAEGGTIIIPQGRYIISSTIRVNNKDDVTIKSSSLGDVILEANALGSGGAIINSKNSDNTIIENLILWGNKEIKAFGVLLENTDHAQVTSNVFYNFDYSLQFWQTTSPGSINNEVIGNSFLDNGYRTLSSFGERIDSICTKIANNFTVKENFLSGNYQGIVLKCTDESTIENNIIVNTDISGIRLENANNHLVRGNLIHRSGLSGMWIYSRSDYNTFINNTIIDNNQENNPFWNDCWAVQQTLKDGYILGTSNPQKYPYFDTENGNPIFTHILCQANGPEVRFQSGVNNNIMQNNRIGRYSNLGWESPDDIYLNYGPLFLKFRMIYLSWNNQFNDNIFLNSDISRINDQGCSNSFANNINIDTNSNAISSFSISTVDNELCSYVTSGDCQMDYTTCSAAKCNNNGVCESERGEQNSLCPTECPKLNLGDSGSRQRGEACASGLTITEPIYPAKSGCINVYDGSFVCTDSSNGVCDVADGENYCNTPTSENCPRK